MGWIDALLFGYRTVYDNGTNPVAQEALNFVFPLRPIEDVGNGWVSISIDPVSSSFSGVVPLTTGANRVCVAQADAATWALLVNDNVDAAAAIAGTKILPNFGAQNINTTGDLTVAGETAVGVFECTSLSATSIDCVSVTATGLVQANNYRAARANTETLGANKVLTVSDSTWQSLDPTVAPYSVEVPVVTSGLAFHINNIHGTQSLAVKNPGGGSTLVTIAALSARWVACAAAAGEDHGPEGPGA